MNATGALRHGRDLFVIPAFKIIVFMQLSHILHRIAYPFDHPALTPPMAPDSSGDRTLNMPLFAVLSRWHPDMLFPCCKLSIAFRPVCLPLPLSRGNDAIQVVFTVMKSSFPPRTALPFITSKAAPCLGQMMMLPSLLPCARDPHMRALRSTRGRL